MMRKALAVFVFLVAASAFAQSNSLSVFLSNPGGGYSESGGSVWNAGYGVEYAHQFAPRWSFAASIARETFALRAETAGGLTYKSDFHTTPLDVTARYHIFNGVRWRPYAGAGLRYVPSAKRGYTASRLTPELSAGVVFQVNRKLGLYVDLKQGIGFQTAPRYDPLTKTSFGVRFGF